MFLTPSIFADGFRHLQERQFGWSPACFAALRGDVQVLKEMLASRVNVNEQVKVLVGGFEHL